MRKIPIRRTDSEKNQVGGFDDGIKRYYDQNMELTVVKLITGDCYYTSEDREMLVTILGSCISVCLTDPLIRAGGMNHILLPGDGGGIDQNSTRFGAYAMEELINGLLKLGAQKYRMKAKIFGGGNVIKNSAMIGQRNIEFVKKYLEQEEIEVLSADVGGDTARRLHFFPDTGKAMVRKLRRKEDYVIVEKEKEYQNKMVAKEPETDVELF